MLRTHQYNSRIKTIVIGLMTIVLSSYMPYGVFNEETFMEEICDNAIDDDGDGMIDLNDPDCDCEVIEPISLIPNPSFEDMNCCPEDRSELDCADVWIQASDPTTDYIHNCGYGGWPEFPPPEPFPDGDGIMGFRDGRVRNNQDPDRNWKEYAGACLLSPLLADSTYRFQFHLGFVDPLRSPNIDITFFGTTDCENLPFGVGNDELGCPTNGPGWTKLASKVVSGGAGNVWVETILEVTPQEDITAIAIGPSCREIFSDISIYYFFDNLILADFRAFQFVVEEVNHPCADNFALDLPSLEGDLTYQWYKDGIAIIGETDSKLSRMYGEGSYQVRVLDEGNCKITAAYNYTVPVFTDPPQFVTICKEDTYPFGDVMLSESGVYQDTIKNEDNCDVAVELHLKVLGEIADTVQARIFGDESYTIGNESFRQVGDHLILLTSSLGCDSLVLLQLDYYEVFTPTAFSPNNDGINDEFTVYGEDELIIDQHFTIFDRWGAIVHEGSTWDGMSKDGDPVYPGVFVYKLDVTFDDNIPRQLYGSFTLIR